MRISDWSSDVCSSDLLSPPPLNLKQNRGTALLLCLLDGVGQRRFGSHRIVIDRENDVAPAQTLRASVGGRIHARDDQAPRSRINAQLTGDIGRHRRYGYTQRLLPGLLAFLLIVAGEIIALIISETARSADHTSEPQSLIANSYSVF